MIPYRIANLIVLGLVDALLAWACWGLPHPYFWPALAALMLANRMQTSLVAIAKATA